MSSSRRVLARQWQIIQYLSAHRNGVRAGKLEEVTERSRATVYRDLQLLREAGIPIETETINGEARHRLLRPVELPHLNLTTMQIWALQLARAELDPLDGTGVVRELDELLIRVRPPERQQSFDFAQRAPRSKGARSGDDGSRVARHIERGLQARRRMRIDYRAASRGGQLATFHIEPLVVHLDRGKAYLRAYCIERSAERLYKLARVERAEMLDDSCTYVPAEPAVPAFANAVKVWRGEPVSVEVRLDRDVAWLAAEYPLIEHQQVQPSSDGSVVVKAEVAGTVEAMRWVLSWGGAAEALSPSELRDATRAELEKATVKYNGPGVARAKARATAARRNKVSRAS